MPFSEPIEALRIIDCRHATDKDRVKVTLKDSRYLVFRTMPELADQLERLPHVRLHVDTFLTPEYTTDRLAVRVAKELTFNIPRAQLREFKPSMIRFFCWADNTAFWTHGSDDSELVAWIQWPDDPKCYRSNTPLKPGSPVESVEFFTV